ncbi:MAG: hypothetical protein Fues2KO_49600 [Fuerstiella sp.]
MILHHLLLIPLELIAQAGGGGNYGGGGGGGGFGGGGGGGSGDGEAIGWLIYLLFRLVFRYPLVGIPTLIIAGVIFYYLQQQGNDYRVARTIRKGRKRQEEQGQQDALETIRTRDPAFREGLFLERATHAFVTTQYAWSEQDLRKCRAFISDGIRERFDLYIRMQQAEGIRNRMRDVQVRHCEIVAIASDSHFDTMHVRFDAEAISYNEDLETARRVSGGSVVSPVSFSEVWSFSRRPGVQTQPAASLLDGRCPNCGGPVEIVDKAECPQCRAAVNSGQYDWVLAEITQAEEWVVPTTDRQVPGWDVLQQRDAGLNVQHIEDRASVIFWRCLMASYFQDQQYAQPILSAERSDVPFPLDPGEGRFWKTPAVGVVELVDAEPAGRDEYDRLRIMVRWSGTRAAGDRTKPQLTGLQQIYTHVLVLKRHQSSVSQTDRTFSSASCSGCGAPIDRGQTASCQFCGTSLNDGRGSWVLEDVFPYSQLQHWIAQSRQSRNDDSHGDGSDSSGLPTDELRHAPELLAIISRLIAVDGQLHNKEKRYLQEFSERRGVPKAQLKQIFETAASDSSPILLPQDRDEANALMDHLLQVALLDGRVSSHEKALLFQVGQQLNWTPADLRIAIARTKRELHQRAKKIISR